MVLEIPWSLVKLSCGTYFSVWTKLRHHLRWCHHQMKKLRAWVSSWDSDKQTATRFHESVRMSGIDGALSTLHSAGECKECHSHAPLRFFKVDWLGGLKQFGIHPRHRQPQCFFFRALLGLPGAGCTRKEYLPVLRCCAELRSSFNASSGRVRDPGF